MSVLQPWVEKLTFMQQSVLITAVRGPDGIPKDHIVKVLLRWYRRCILYCAFGRKIITNPYTKGGGSFTGPCTTSLKNAIDGYLRSVDEVPHHFQLHFMHAAEILGYKHPNKEIAKRWFDFYCKIVNDAHLSIETKEQMEYRLGDSEKQWRDKEETPAL